MAVSKNSATSAGFSPLNKVQLIVTRKPLALANLDGRHRLVEHPFLAHRLVVPLPIAVQVDREGEVGGGLVFIDVLGEQDGVGAQIHELLARHDARDDLRHFLVDQRFAARNGHDGAPHSSTARIASSTLTLFCRIPSGNRSCRSPSRPGCTGQGVFQHEHQWIVETAPRTAQLASRDASGRP